ncbi:haloalkane dehalogenase [Dokdonella sp.]|uniref:haloalkane dehalogenase n=1 Tax=Dokdonella sp. TaxID=2291710 RepID=UPI003527E987
MQVLRTPDACFENLPGYAFEPRYLELTDAASGRQLRMAYVDEGPRDAAPVLLMHGEPSWSYLYRKMIPLLVAAGHRVVAPDLIGFGRSDKPTAIEDYSYQRHVDWMGQFLDEIDPGGMTLCCQDWGGLIGLRLVAEHGERFARVLAANTFLPTGDHDLGKAFHEWREFARSVPVLPIGQIVSRGCAKPLTEAEIAAYDAPFPDETYKAGARAFPLLVPASPDDPAAEPNRRAWKRLMQWDKPFLTAFSDQDPITRGADAILQKLIPGAASQVHRTLAGGGHFLQEDVGPELAGVLADFIAAS